MISALGGSKDTVLRFLAYSVFLRAEHMTVCVFVCVCVCVCVCWPWADTELNLSLVIIAGCGRSSLQLFTIIDQLIMINIIHTIQRKAPVFLSIFLFLPLPFLRLDVLALMPYLCLINQTM